MMMGQGGSERSWDRPEIQIGLVSYWRAVLITLGFFGRDEPLSFSILIY